MPEDAWLRSFTCRCGRTQCRSFLQPPACFGCFHCGTNLTTHRALSSQKFPHEPYNEDVVLSADGSRTMTVEICKWCGKMDAEHARRSVIV